MSEATWLVLVIWLALLTLGFKIRKEYGFKTVAAVIGLMFSLGLMGEGNTLMNVTGFALLILNVYLLFTALVIEEGK